MSPSRRLYRNRFGARDVVMPEANASIAPDTAPRMHVIGRRLAALSLLATALGMTGLAQASGGPTGGQIVGGSGQIQQVGNTTTIRQNSQTLSLNWQSFDIAPNQTVNFLQPGSGAIAINRIFSSTPSEIFGHLNANGQVWLINPNGILFGQGAQVNVGGLVASTLDFDDSTLDSSNRRFSGNGKGSIINRGSLTAGNGGYIALLGNQVSNQGVVTAQLGTVAMGGGSAVTLTFAGNQVVHLEVDQSTLNNLVENRQLVVADGGRVIMTAGAKDSLLASVVNNTGVVQAQTVQNHNGEITLLGGMTAGSVNVGGTLDASAPKGGNGGFIETSGAQAHIADGSVITTKAAGGKDGMWLVDPTDFTIDTSGGDITPAALETDLAAGNISFASSNGASGTSGNVNVNAPVTWSANTTLTLTASNNINLGAVIKNTGTSGKTVLNAGNAFVNNVGAGGLVGNWAIYSASPTATGENLGGLVPGFIQYNAPIGTAAVAGATGNGVFYSLAPTLSVSGVTGTVKKTYDGTTSATLANGNFTDTGLVNGDIIASAAGTYSQSDVGTGLTVTSPSSIAGFNIVNGSTPVYGYALSGASKTANIGEIDAAQLTASIVGNPTKVYDGSTTATLNSSNYQINGFVAGQGATVNQPSSVAYDGVDAGAHTINATFAITNFVANAGTNLSNYIMPPSAFGAGTITPAPVLLSGLLANSKVYDGTTAATLNLGNASIFGVIDADAGNVTLSTAGGTGNFAQANAGNGIAVNVSGFTLTGSKAFDYQLIAPTNLTANITPKALTVSGVTANNKTYDGTTADSLNVGGATLNGKVGSDDVSLSTSASGTFSQSDVGSNLAVTVNGFGLTGADAGNYTVVQPTGLLANITQAMLTVSFAGSPTKIYDRTDFATLGSSDFNITGFVNGEGAVVSQSPAIYAQANAGTNIGVTATLQYSDFTPNAGTKLSNYDFTHTVIGTGTISPAQLAVAIQGNPTKTYDSTTAATLSPGNYVLSGVITGDNVTLNSAGLPTTGNYASANVGTWLISALLSGAAFSDGGTGVLSNYALPTLVNGYGTITPATLDPKVLIAGINHAVSKTYDGTNALILNLADGSGHYTQEFTLSGFQGTDSAHVNANITGNFASKNVGTQPFQVNLGSSDITFDSGSASNYNWPSIIYTTGTINPALLTVGIVGNPTKVYDGSTLAQLTSSNFQINGFVAGEGGSITPTTSFNYSSANAGSNTISGTLTANNYNPNAGTSLSNYTLAFSASGPGTITQAPLYVTGVYATNKIYDTTASDTLNIATVGLSGLVASDAGNVTLNTSTSGTFAQSNAGNGIAVTANGFSISGSAASNYLLQPITGLVANITPKALTVSGITASNKTYDGTTSDTLNTAGYSLNGVLGSDNVTLDINNPTATFSTANVGSNLDVSYASGLSLGGAQAGNYTLTQPGGLKANITKANLSVTITGNPTKVYDGSDSATLTAGDYTITGFVTANGVTQSATLPQSETANYLSPNAGSGVGVKSTLVTSDWLAGPGTLLSNYNLPTSATGTGTITPYVLNLSGTRVYDTTSNALGSLFGTITGLNGDSFTLSGQGSSSSKNVGTYTGTGASSGSQPFNLGSLALVANGAALASNYTLIGGADTFVITPAILTVSGTVAANKVYDATRAATLSGSTLNGVLGSDTVTLGNDTAGTFATKNVGTGIAVSTNMTISGSDAGNYIIQQPTGITANITPLAINVTATGTDRQYDGTVNDNVTLAGTLAGDNVTLSDSSATFGDANVGNGKTVTVSGISLGGASAGNYTLNNTSTTTTANITPRVLDLSGTRVYDANTDANASLFGSSGVITTGIGTETVNLGGSGTVSNKNVGSYTGGNFNLSTLTLSNGSNGGLASNYTLVGGTDTLNITPATLTVTGTVAANKIYDGTTAASLSGSVLNGVFGGDNVTLGNDTVGQFNTKDVGTGKPVSTSMTVSGGDSSNYVLVQPTGITANITQRAITVTATGTNRVYDGTLNDTVTLSGTLSGDNVTINDTSALFTDPNVGTGKTVTVSGISLSGASAGNYTLNNTSTTTTADITPVILNLTGTRTYDSTTNAAASLFGSNGVLTGVNGETLTLSGTGALSTKNVGTQQAFAVNGLSGFTLTGNNGALASNYTLAGGTDWVTISPYVLSLSGTRTYDATTGAAASLFGSNGVLTGVNGETINLAGSGVLNSKNVGTQGFAGFGSLALSNGSNGGLASNYTLVGGTDSVVVNPYVLDLTSTRAYDGTTGAVASLFGSNGTLTGVSGETVKLSGSGVLSSPNVGTQQAFSNLGTLTLANGSGGGLASNYTLTGGTDWVTITPYVLSLTGTRVYDSTTNAAASLFGSNGMLTGVNGETLTLSGTGTLSTKNVGTQQAFAVNGLSGFALAGNNGALASNYTLAGGTDWVTISPYVLNLSGTRTYDATTGAAASLFGSNGVLTGVNGETINLAGSGVLNSKNVGTQGFAGFGSLALSDGSNGGLAGNYTLVGGTDQVTITKAPLTVAGTVAADKIYDGNDTAQLSGATLSGLLGSDDVTLGNATAGTFASKNVGSNIAVGTSMTITGTDIGNYDFTQPTGITANITPYVLNLIGTRVYDGSTSASASLFGSSGTLAGVNGETVNLSGTGVLMSKHVGTQSFANFGSLALSDGTGLAGNYTLIGGTDQVTITKLSIVVDATGQNKTYDGNTTAGVTLGSNGVLAGDVVNFGDGAANFSTPNAGSNVSIAVTGINASGADAGDYAFNTTAATSATINPYVLSLTSTRVYDGTTGADASLFGNNGVISTGVNGETVDVSGSGVLTSKNVGSQRAFANLGSLVLGNGTGLATNYTLAGGTDWVSITPATLTVIGTTTTNRVYDGTTIDALNGATLSGVFGNDNVALGNDSTGLFGNKNVGNGKAVTTAMTISGGDAGNYILLQPIGLTANVTPLSITVTATGTNRMYNGQVGDVVALSTNGVLPGDQLSLADASATFADPYVGNGKMVTVSGITASGADAGNYVIADPVTTTTANITSAGFAGTGVQGSWVAQLQGGLPPFGIATPYGSTNEDAVGVFTGNQQMKHKPVERNRARSDFRSGLSLQFQNGGVRLPSDASP